MKCPTGRHVVPDGSTRCNLCPPSLRVPKGALARQKFMEAMDDLVQAQRAYIQSGEEAGGDEQAWKDFDHAYSRVLRLYDDAHWGKFGNDPDTVEALHQKSVAKAQAKMAKLTRRCPHCQAATKGLTCGACGKEIP